MSDEKKTVVWNEDDNCSFERSILDMMPEPSPAVRERNQRYLEEAMRWFEGPRVFEVEYDRRN